jgi:hypothetical protein
VPARWLQERRPNFASLLNLRASGKELGVQYYHLINDILLLARTPIGSVALGSGVHRDVCELLNGGVAPLLPVDQPIVLIPRSLGATVMPLIDAEPYEFALEPMRAALVIIDMQRDFLEPGGFGESLGNDVSLLRRTIAPTRRLLDATRAVGLMVIHTCEGHRADLADLPPAKKARGRPSLAIGEAGAMGRLLVRGEPGHDIVPSCIRSRASRSSPRSKQIAGRGEPDARRATLVGAG